MRDYIEIDGEYEVKYRLVTYKGHYKIQMLDWGQCRSTGRRQYFWRDHGYVVYRNKIAANLKITELRKKCELSNAKWEVVE